MRSRPKGYTGRSVPSLPAHLWRSHASPPAPGSLACRTMARSGRGRGSGRRSGEPPQPIWGTNGRTHQPHAFLPSSSPPTAPPWRSRPGPHAGQRPVPQVPGSRQPRPVPPTATHLAVAAWSTRRAATRCASARVAPAEAPRLRPRPRWRSRPDSAPGHNDSVHGQVSWLFMPRLLYCPSAMDYLVLGRRYRRPAAGFALVHRVTGTDGHHAHRLPRPE